MNSLPALSAEVPIWKRVLDFVCIIAALPGIVFFMLLIAAFIKLVSRGPILFRQERVGFRCQRFMCLKFRTMHIGADPSVHRRHLNELLHGNMPMTKMDATGDPRLIPCGAMLRAMGLDELPQLMNVLRGEMSLVGPRPCVPYEFERYHPSHHARFDTLPGLTGLWQVRGKNKTTFTEMIDLDIHYARNKSLGLDLQIMVETFATLAAQLKEVRATATRKKRPTVKTARPGSRHTRRSRVVGPIHHGLACSEEDGVSTLSLVLKE